MNNGASGADHAPAVRRGGLSGAGADGGQATPTAQEDLVEACRLLSRAADSCLASCAPWNPTDVAAVADVADFRSLSLGLGAQLVASQILSLIPLAQNAGHEARRTNNVAEVLLGAQRLDPSGTGDSLESKPATATSETRLMPAESLDVSGVTPLDLVRAADTLIRRHPVDDLPSGVPLVIAAISDLLSEVAR